MVSMITNEMNVLSTFASDATSKLDILRHDGDSFGMDGT